MSEVIANMSMSLDGFVADTNDGIEQVFGWYGSGDVAVPTAVEWATFRTSEASAGVLRHGLATIGALIGGRRLFDLASGWNGQHPMGVPVFIVTHQEPTDWAHPEAPFTFVTDGIESAVAKAKAAAGDKNVAVASPTVVQQCLDAGLLDAVQVDLVPVLLGQGIPFFGELAKGPVQLDGPTVVEGQGVTHLTYRVRR
ncbi:dihydrofolate reductase family protein [Kutzneria chonburiensis]|uniref:Dihydrofolate reductase family protein n=1 Tax=Kutzneria chonburiensis TaxID=1483604 RepID=A0ABV6N6W0_9PSEU|nr:dihydrofolate reductase family protein [Kutzneria chonburiensis]